MVEDGKRENTETWGVKKKKIIKSVKASIYAKLMCFLSVTFYWSRVIFLGTKWQYYDNDGCL